MRGIDTSPSPCGHPQKSGLPVGFLDDPLTAWGLASRENHLGQWPVLQSRVMRRPAARVLSTRARQPLGFGPNRVVVCCFWVAFHIYHQTPHCARWGQAPIRLFPVRGPPGQLQKSLPQAPPASACVPLGRMAEAKGLKSRTWALVPMLLIQDGFKVLQSSDSYIRHVFLLDGFVE